MKLVKIFTLLILLTLSATAIANDKFPTLEGRVTDDAKLLPDEEYTTLTAQLKQQEDNTGQQVVIATITSLHGMSIESYANQLFRQWGLGQKEKNNGVLLLVAPNERKVRIEVGYGLEGTLTDTTSQQIIENIILPEFKKNNMSKGITDGTAAILTVLNGQEIIIRAPFEYTPSSNRSFDLEDFATKVYHGDFDNIDNREAIFGTVVVICIVIFGFVIGFLGILLIYLITCLPLIFLQIVAVILTARGKDGFEKFLIDSWYQKYGNLLGGHKGESSYLGSKTLSQAWHDAGSGGGSSSGGFSGGGGSSGGGGASGSW